MKKKIVLFVLALATFQVSLAQTEWKADPKHTNVRFNIKHLGISFIDGFFKEIEGHAVTEKPDKINGAEFNFTIKVKSIDTRVQARDAHLRSDEFFHVSKYPTITLRDATLKHKEGNKFTLTGDLTIKDVTKEVSFRVRKNGPIITDPWGNKRVGLTAFLTIDRMDYGINYTSKLPSGIPAVGHKVEIVINTEMVKQKK